MEMCIILCKYNQRKFAQFCFLAVYFLPVVSIDEVKLTFLYFILKLFSAFSEHAWSEPTKLFFSVHP